MSSKTAAKLKEAQKRRRQEKRLARQNRKNGLREREVEVRDAHPTILIVCEGEKTEPNYFRSFRVTNANVQVVGLGMNTHSLVQEALRLKEHHHSDELWVVFDRDSFKAEQVTKAFKLAKNSGVRVAYSHEAFEIWYLLHFDYCDANLSRNTYKERLSKCLNQVYKKNDENMYSKLSSHTDIAISNATRLLKTHEGKARSEAGPSTTVHLLVQRLRRFTR